MGEETVLARFGVQLQDVSDKIHPPRWDECDDIEIRDESGLIYAGPRYFRCARPECHCLVTHGMVQGGGCWCGNRRLAVALRLTTEEKNLLKRGYYPLVGWEVEQIAPTVRHEMPLGWGKADWRKRYA